MGLQQDVGDVSVEDIRLERIGSSIRDEIYRQLQPGSGNEKRMPTMLLYDEKGLKLFEDLTYLEEYYLTNAEIRVLEHHAAQIAERIVPDSILLELGSGNLRKVSILLQAIERAEKDVHYYALDLSLSELQRTLSVTPHGKYKHIHCHGLLGTYDDGLEWLKQPRNLSKPKCVLSLGSSIGNFDRLEAAQFLKKFADILDVRDIVLVGVDACQTPDKVYRAYNDSEGKTHEFYRNGLRHANRLLAKEAFTPEDWNILGEYDAVAGRHQAFYVARRELEIAEINFAAGEKVRFEESYKYSKAQSDRLWHNAGLAQGAVFGEDSGDYYLHMLSKAKFSFPLDPKKYASVPVPTFEEYKELWAAWDTVTREMIDEEELLSKPIELRNCCLFYLGHIPTFLDIHVSRATKSIATKPDYFRDIFERGVDPDVDNPEECHSHSEIPDSWPPASDILAFQERVRQRTAGLYETKAVEANRRLGRALWLGLEHEAMHLETLLYMLLQSEKTLPPPGVRPDFQALADTAQAHAVPNDWVKVPAMKFDVGLEDPENDLGPDRYFGWDNEKPSRCVAVSTFEAKARPITNEEYAQYLERTDKKILPASWVSVSSQKAPLGQAGPSDGRMSNGRFRTDSESGNVTDAFLADKAVRTVYGPVPLKFALDWPMIASYDELRGCAKWMGGRIPTFEETRSIYRYVDYRKREQAENVLGQTISAVNGHLSNNGVEESPPSRSSHFNLSNSKHGPDPSEIFINLENCNVGFKHFHPIPVTQNGSRLSGQAEMGGAWEWTSSVLEKHTGFEAMEVYPGYTADFFDGKHNIVLGGSWATHPRLAGRKTLYVDSTEIFERNLMEYSVNWYQRNYPYAWASARLVRDIVE